MIKTRIKLALVAMVLALVTGCMGTSKVNLTPIEIQSMQSRQYENDQKVVFKSVISVFQDLGYSISDADIATGLITADSAAESDATSKFFTGMSKVSQTKVSAFVEQIGDITNVRLNFVESAKSSSEYGQTDREDNAILDVAVYNNAFERIENAIFVRSAN